MTPYARWTTREWPVKRQSNQLLCVECGEIRPTLHLPNLAMDPITTTLGPLIWMGMGLHAAQAAQRMEAP